MENVQLKSRKNDYINENQCKCARKYFREHNEVTGIHALRYLTEKRSKSEKIFWAIFLTISLICCICMIYEICYKYRNSPVVLNFQSDYTSIYDIPFPAITICSQSKSLSAKFNISAINMKAKRNETLTKNESIGLSYLNNICNDGLHETMPDLENYSNDFYQFIDEVTPMDQYYGIEWKNQEFEFSQLFVPVITNYGVCFSFNIFNRKEMFREETYQYSNFLLHEKSAVDFDGEIGFKENSPKHTFPRRTSLSGMSNALNIYLLQNVSDMDFSCSLFEGFIFQIHSPWVYPSFSRKSFQLPADRYVSASIKPEVIKISEEVKRYPAYKRKCYLRNERPLKFFKIYTQSSCHAECLANFTLLICDCVDFYMPHNSNTSLCGPAKYSCKEKVAENFTRNDFEHSCDCKPTCTDLAYKTEISQATFYVRKYFEMHQEDYGEMDVNRMKYTMLTIYFESPQFLALERNELYGITDLISNIGGLLGLFTGFSLLTMVEIIYFLSVRIYCNYKLYGQWHGNNE